MTSAWKAQGVRLSWPRPFGAPGGAALTSGPGDGLASNACGSVFGLLITALAWTYFPPTAWMTSAYWFSAPMATIAPSGVVEPDAKEDAQPDSSPAPSARTSGALTARPLQPLGITVHSQRLVGQPSC